MPSWVNNSGNWDGVVSRMDEDFLIGDGDRTLLGEGIGEVIRLTRSNAAAACCEAETTWVGCGAPGVAARPPPTR